MSHVYLRPHVARLGRALPLAKVTSISDKQPTQPAAPALPHPPVSYYAPQASPSFYVASPPIPQVFLVYGPPAGYVTPFYARPPPPSAHHQFSAPPPPSFRPQPARGLHTRSRPHRGPAAGLGLADETLFAPVQNPTGYLAAYGGGHVYAPYAAQAYPSAPSASSAAAAPGYADDAESVDDALSMTSMSDSASVQEEGRLHPGMTVDELYFAVQHHLTQHPTISVTWLNRLFSKCTSTVDFAKALEIFHLYQSHNVETTAETGTLLIKAACRAGVPDKALNLLRNLREVRLWPTLGGIHYLMINFSIRRDTQSVLSTFEATRERRLKPNVRTYHILIRECVDNQQIDQALSFAADCKAQHILPNRVMYNILMNGCRKANKPSELLELRAEMDAQQLELNDTTVKFTILAHLMLGQTTTAVQHFLAFTAAQQQQQQQQQQDKSDGSNAIDAFAEKFLDELTPLAPPTPAAVAAAAAAATADASGPAAATSQQPQPQQPQQGPSAAEREQHVRLVRTLFDAVQQAAGRPIAPSLVARLDAAASADSGDAGSRAANDDADSPSEHSSMDAVPLRRTV